MLQAVYVPRGALGHGDLMATGHDAEGGDGLVSFTDPGTKAGDATTGTTRACSVAESPAEAGAAQRSRPHWLQLDAQESTAARESSVRHADRCKELHQGLRTSCPAFVGERIG